MRQVLIYILLKHPFAWGELDIKSGVPGFGSAWILTAGLLIWLAIQKWYFRAAPTEIKQGLLPWGVAIMVSIFLVPSVGPTRLPIFGYGMMVLIGFLSGLWLSRLRAKRIGLNPEILSDMSFWLLISGVLGGRIAHLVQFRQSQFVRCQTVFDYVKECVNLTEGGLVLIGALAGGAIGFFGFCRSRKLPVLFLADVIMPGVFVGVGFGRIGCLLNGCCYGAACNLPWAIQFPQSSLTWESLVRARKLDSSALWTMPLHPTQIYSTLDGFILATILWNYFPLRSRNGQVFGLGCSLYACTRFLIERLRDDTKRMSIGQLADTLMFWKSPDRDATGLPSVGGMTLTISQWYSIGIFLGGATLLVWLFLRGQPATLLVVDSDLQAPSPANETSSHP